MSSSWQDSDFLVAQNYCRHAAAPQKNSAMFGNCQFDIPTEFVCTKLVEPLEVCIERNIVRLKVRKRCTCRTDRDFRTYDWPTLHSYNWGDAEAVGSKLQVYACLVHGHPVTSLFVLLVRQRCWLAQFVRWNIADSGCIKSHTNVWILFVVRIHIEKRDMEKLANQEWDYSWGYLIWNRRISLF